MNNLDKYDEILSILVDEIEIDGKKYYLKEEFEKFFIRNNKEAGKRIRKIMQEIRVKAKDVRKAIQDVKKTI